jgi:hypothetical protein
MAAIDRAAEEGPSARQPSRKAVGRFVVLGVVALAAGCGGLALTPVEGKVTLDGRPLAKVIVAFYPLAESGEASAPSSSGMTDEMGSYRLTCKNGKEGAAVGRHRAIVCPSPQARNPGGSPPPPPPTIPLPYTSVLDTPLQIEVKADRREYHLKLTTPPTPFAP